MSSNATSAMLQARPTVADLQADNNPYAQFARDHWASDYYAKSGRPPSIRPVLLKSDLWDILEKENFAYASLLVLENLQMLEKYLWPGFSEDASYHHMVLLAILVNVKRREGLEAWEHFADRPDEFSVFFRRILNLSLSKALPVEIRVHSISFIIGAFQSLDNGLVRKECAPLVSVSIWHNLHSDSAREARLDAGQMLRRAWRGCVRRFDNADDETKSRLIFERSWLFRLLLELLDLAYEIPGGSQAGESQAGKVLICERLMELLADLESQLPTRRYVNALVRDLNLVSAIRLSPMFSDEDNGLFRDLYVILNHYVSFPVDDQTGQQRTPTEDHQAQNSALSRLQRIAHSHFKEKLGLLALSNYGSLESRSDLDAHLQVLDLGDLAKLCKLLGIRTQYPQNSRVVPDRDFLVELIIAEHEKKMSFRDSIRELALLPTEQTLYESTFLRCDNYDGSRPLAIPKLNLQYLTMGDFLWRAFILHRCNAFYGIRKHVEDTIKRVKARSTGTETRFNGFSRMALPIPKVAVQDVAPPNVGQDISSQVRAEVVLEMGRLDFSVRQEWESLRPGDAVFMAAVYPPGRGDQMMLTNGNEAQTEGQKLGLKYLRVAEVLQVQDDSGRPLRDNFASQQNGQSRRNQQRRLIVKMDPIAYKADMEKAAERGPSVYDAMNLIIRRRGRENNFKAILESIKRLTLSDVPAPAWLQDVFLGYGDPAGATYKRLPNRLKSVDFRDTFVDWQHLIESFPGKVIEPNEEMEGSFPPPYVLQTAETTAVPAPQPSKKRRRDEDVPLQASTETIRVSTYDPPNNGPYPADALKVNTVRFTPAQIEATASGTQPGLTVILGPPGTGKTDVATQIINNIYHNFPSQRTLLIAHSNQALNQLFQKIVALDVDERHLLRLGQGEEELETDANYSKYGRVESFLERGAQHLAEVDRLAANFGVQGAHGSSCETADYFNSVHVKPVWTGYWELVQAESTSVEQIMEEFPFYPYFSNAPQPLFPANASKEHVTNIVAGCYRHIEKIFSELEDIRPFEILRSARDKANYLLIKEARIIAMTSTHAAMRRQEIADLGFHYDNVIIEEAAQITEMETFIPLALQKPQDGQLPLQRIVLCGDHLQNSPVIEYTAFRQYANLEQSLFLRLIKLGVPAIMLDKQGRARPSLAELYKWRYPKLGNLPNVESLPEFQTSNAGLRYDYQFIDVPDYKGKGELEPTPHFIQNLGEAEYVVAMFMYMRLLGYPAHKISILTTYAGQRALIRDVLSHRCKGNWLFGMPRTVATVDKYQGEQNDYVLLSLVRTRSVGYLRDIRRLTVALSRARLGLYVFGRQDVFEACYELKTAFDKLFERPTKLLLVTGEMYPCSRPLTGEVDEERVAEMEGLEHLGLYVFQMTQDKVAALKAQGEALPAIEEATMADADADDGEGLVDEAEGDDMGPELEEENRE